MQNETVALVLDAQYGDKLDSLATEMPVWIVGSEVNRQAVERLWKVLPGASLTKFNDASTWHEPQAFLSLLENIDLHHGPYSSPQPVHKVRVLGCALSSELRMALVRRGLVFKVEGDGFQVELNSPFTEERS